MTLRPRDFWWFTSFMKSLVINTLTVSEDEVLFFEPDDAVSLANVVAKLSKDAKLRHKLALSAWRKAESYSWEARAKKIKVFIKSLT